MSDITPHICASLDGQSCGVSAGPDRLSAEGFCSTLRNRLQMLEPSHYWRRGLKHHDSKGWSMRQGGTDTLFEHSDEKAIRRHVLPSRIREELQSGDVVLTGAWPCPCGCTLAVQLQTLSEEARLYLIDAEFGVDNEFLGEVSTQVFSWLGDSHSFVLGVPGIDGATTTARIWTRSVNDRRWRVGGSCSIAADGAILEVVPEARLILERRGHRYVNAWKVGVGGALETIDLFAGTLTNEGPPTGIVRVTASGALLAVAELDGLGGVHVRRRDVSGSWVNVATLGNVWCERIILHGEFLLIETQRLGRRDLLLVKDGKPHPVYPDASELGLSVRLISFDSDSGSGFISVEGRLTPRTIIALEFMETGVRLGREFRESPQGIFCSQDYKQAVAWFQSTDGVAVPVTVLSRPTVRTVARIVRVYGAYGASLESFFSPEDLALTDLGVEVHYAHVRGGGELGYAWHDAGAAENKVKACEDLLAYLEILTAESRIPIILVGSSAGAVPALYAAMRAKQPCTLYLSAPLLNVERAVGSKARHGASNRIEWGGLDEDQRRSALAEYDPMVVARVGKDTPILIDAYGDDVRTPLRDAREFVEMRQSMGCKRTTMRVLAGGHGGGASREEIVGRRLEGLASAIAEALNLL